MSVSVTTRKPRPGEVDGVDYIFVDRREFERLKKRRRKLLEWAEVFGHLYATPRAPVLDALQSGNDVLFDVDWQGARQLKKTPVARCGARIHSATGRQGARAAAQGAQSGFRGHGGASHGACGG